jgi:hypothetical protein
VEEVFSEVRLITFNTKITHLGDALPWGSRLDLVVATTGRKNSPPSHPLEKGVRLMATKILAVNVLLALGVCVFAVTLAVLLSSSLSPAAAFEWLTTQPPSSCGGYGD